MESRTPIRVEHLNVWYGGHPALKDVTLSIPDRKITAIIGPSGCGKTTLLKTFNRLIDLQDDVRVEGRIFVDGEDICAPGTDLTGLRKKMGLLFQRPQVLPMTIFENVAYGLRIHGTNDRKILLERVEHYLRMAGLWNEVKDRLHAPAHKLSIGQQQRLCLARGLAVEPEIILGDEATSALDPISSKTIEELFVTIKDKYTVVLVTHTLRQAKRIADYVAFMYMGELIEFGTADQLFNHPKNQLTKEYISGGFS